MAKYFGIIFPPRSMQLAATSGSLLGSSKNCQSGRPSLKSSVDPKLTVSGLDIYKNKQ